MHFAHNNAGVSGEPRQLTDSAYFDNRSAFAVDGAPAQ